MGYWKKQHELRGNFLEECINQSNEIYREKGLAVVEKLPTPITPVEIDHNTGRISLAYFKKKSTVDYIGNVQGIPICFDAKETNLEYLPLENIHEHQIAFMKDFAKQEGLSFLIIRFNKYEETYLYTLEDLIELWDKAQKGGRKSIPYTDMKGCYRVKRDGNILMHYLEPLSFYLESRAKKGA